MGNPLVASPVTLNNAPANGGCSLPFGSGIAAVVTNNSSKFGPPKQTDVIDGTGNIISCSISPLLEELQFLILVDIFYIFSHYFGLIFKTFESLNRATNNDPFVSMVIPSAWKPGRCPFILKSMRIRLNARKRNKINKKLTYIIKKKKNFTYISSFFIIIIFSYIIGQ